MKSAFFEVDNFPHNFGGLVWIKWITGESNVWFVQVVQSGGNGGIMEEKLRRKISEFLEVCGKGAQFLSGKWFGRNLGRRDCGRWGVSAGR